MSTWSELKDRKVLRAVGAYVAFALALCGGVDLATNAFGLSSSWLRFTIMVCASGLPVVIGAAWFFDLHPAPADTEDSGRTGAHRWRGMLMGLAAGAAIFIALLTILEPAESTGPAISVPGLGDRGAIAVMPFENLSEDGSDAHFAEGIADDIVTSLQGWAAFPVISRSSTRAYRGQDMSPPSVAAALGVRYLLIGSVRTADAHVRVTAQLIDAETDTQLWAETFDRTLEDVFAIQDEITQEIVTAIAPEMTRSEMRRGAVEHPADLATWELVVRAQALVLEGDYQAVLKARELLLLAIEREPGYALAYALLAEIGHDTSNYYSRIVGDEAASAALREGLDHAREAVRLNPSLVDARVWHGHLLLHDRQVELGLQELQEAVRLNPSHAQARAELSLGLAIAGEVDAALSELERAYRLGPNDPHNDRIRTFEALAHLYANQNEEAAASARRIIDSQIGSALNVYPYVVEVSALIREGRIEEARASVAEFRSHHGELDWPAIDRGAWSQEQLNRVREDLMTAGMIG
jgi:adenylate cyclase